MIKKIYILLIFLFLILSLNSLTTGLVLSGGGTRALSQIGVLKVLDSLDVKVDYISATSTGAFIGALYSMGYTGKEIEELFKKYDWRKIFDDNISRKDYNISEKRWMPFSKYYFYIDKIYKPQFPKAFLFGENFILKLFELTYPTYKLQNYNKLPIKFRCVATNLLTGEKTIFKKGYLHENIRASMAFPAILQPFKIGKNFYIDGGITDNFPVDVIKYFKPDFVIGVRTNTNLKNIDEMSSALDILKQTVNINIIKKVKKESNGCDLIIQPKLNSSFMDFSYEQNIVNIGEKEAKKYLSILSKLPKWNGQRPKKLKLNSKIKIDKIIIKGNRYLSQAKVLEYLNLQSGKSYTITQIIKAFKRAYNTDLFNYIYPVLQNENNRTVLKVIEEERLRKRVGFNFTIRNDDEFSGNIYGIFTNLLQKNSKLILNAKFGTEKELVEDYVKNFGRNWGAYFRIFSNWSEKKFIVYNDSTYFKTKSIRNKETEINLGSGIFIKSIIAAELYGYFYKTDLSRDIGEYLGENYQSFGLGFKIYHESLDNFVFPMKGIRILSKYKVFKIENVKTTQFNFLFKSKFFLNFYRNTTLIYSNELGTMRFNSPSQVYTPFTIGGLDSFLGLNKNEISSMRYFANRIGLRKKIKNVYLDAQFNALIYKKQAKLDLFGFGIKLGIDTFFGPIKIAVAINDHGQKFLYFSLGYNFDPFEFSRR